MSYEFRMTSRVNAERVDVFMSGRLATFVNVFRSEINPRIEISIENTSTGMFLKLFCRHVWMFSYLLNLNNFDFWKFVSWHIVSSSTNIFDSSQITMSGRTHDWNAIRQLDRNLQKEDRLGDVGWFVCAFVSSPQSWPGFCCVGPSIDSGPPNSLTERACLFAGSIFDSLDCRFCSTVSNWMLLAAVVGMLSEQSGTSSLGVTPTIVTTALPLRWCEYTVMSIYLYNCSTAFII